MTERFAAPESYTPKHLAEKILTSKAALEGEREELARSHGLAMWTGVATMLTGRLMIQRGRQGDGLAKAARALPALRSWRYAAGVCFLAESWAAAGEPSKGLEVLAEGLATAEREGTGWHLSELYRLRGELLMMVSAGAQPMRLPTSVAPSKSREAKRRSRWSCGRR